MPGSVWSTQQLAEFLAVFASAQTEASAALAAVERAAEALDAEVAAIVSGDKLVASVGYPEGSAPVAELAAVTPGVSRAELSVPGVGPCAATAVSLAHPPGATFVIARAGNGGLSPEEAGLLRGMAQVTSMTLRTMSLLTDERAARRESERQAAENARLLTALTERQDLLERLVDEQAALRRVATLVAQGAPPDAVFAAGAEEVQRLLRVDIAGMGRYELDGTLAVLASWGRAGPVLPDGIRRTLGGENISTIVFETGRPARVDVDASGPPTVASHETEFRSSVGTPIIVDGNLWGLMGAGSRWEPLPADTEERLAQFTELLATAIANAESRAALAASRARIVTAADEARRRIERDLHDRAQQRLISLGLEVRAAQAAVPSELDGLARDLSRVAEALTSVFEELREISHGIHPAILSEQGLAPALRALARRSPLPVELESDLARRLPEPLEVAVYYVVSEAVTNAAKHARASTVTVELSADDVIVRLAIRDDGIGGADPHHGSGLLGLTDRLEALGGRLQITSPAGSGTTLLIEIPLLDGPTPALSRSVPAH
jgi:signal transduction histidine kinase